MKTLIEVYRLNGSFYALEKLLRVACAAFHADLTAILRLLCATITVCEKQIHKFFNFMSKGRISSEVPKLVGVVEVSVRRTLAQRRKKCKISEFISH